MIIASPQNYWLSSNALTFTLNANGSAEYLFANSSPGAAILCYIKGVEGLEYDAGHNYRRWPLVVSLTHFSTPSAKYIYVKIPKSAATSEYASVIFPSELLDIYGKNEAGDQIGSTDSYYIWLQGIISASEVHGVLQDRYMQEPIQWGTLSSDEAIDAGGYNAWWSYSSVDEIVTFLKSIVMKAGTTFHNIILGNKELTGVATAETSDDYIDSDYLVVTPNYLKSKYLSRQKDDTAEGYIGFIQGLWVGVKDLFGIAANGDAKVNGLSVNGDANIAGQLVVKSSKQDTIASSNYNGEGIGDTGFRLTNDDGSGRSKLTVDRLYVRQDFTTETLQVKRSYVTSGNHVDSAAANTISRTDYLQLNSSTGVYELIGYETVKVPFTVKQRLLAILKWQLSDVFSRTRTIRKPVSVGDIDRIRCYFLANDGNKRIDNNWMVGDLARCQTFNIDGSWQRNTWLTSSGTHTGNVFWWRKVVAVSSAPVEIDGLSYHYFDVAMDDCALGSHIPAEEDEVCQWGHVSNPDRMNLIVHEVTGSDAPAIKSYEGIYCYDLTKSWFGGNTKKMNLSPKTEYLFNGRKFRIETDYGVQPISVDRGEWSNITKERDDYSPHSQVTKCYYGDKVTHSGCYWRCILSNNGEHWVDSSGNYISDTDYEQLTPEQKATCIRKQNYITVEPADNSAVWEKQVDRGEKGDDGTSPNTNILLRTIFDKGIDFVKEAWTGDFNHVFIDGASDTPIEGHKCIRINASTLPTGEYADFSQNVKARVKPATWYTLSFNYFSTGGSTDKFLETFVWSGASGYTAIDVSEGMYIDGVHQSAAATRGDGCVQWPSDWTGKRHSVTFKTVGTFNTDYVNILFRCNAGGQAAICMPKLEEGKTATAYMANDDDLIGKDGKDGWMITANPANVIITQALTNASASFSTATVSFTAKKGSVSATISSIGTPTSEEFVVAKKGSTGDDAKKVLVSSPKTHGDPAAYYTEGSFEVTLDVVDPDTNNTVTFSVTVLCYANPMGVWKTEIEGDVETSVAQKITYGYDHETGAVGSLEAVGKYIRSSEENISILTKKVNNGKNLLNGVLLGTDWKSTSATTLNAVRHDITVNNGVFTRATGDSYIMSPVFAIEANKYYTASFIGGGNYTFTIVADNGTPAGISIASQGGGGGGKLSFSFRSATAYSAVYVFFGVASLQQPQVEEGSTATDFEADTTELSSQIRQTAENIEFSVNDGLQRTGIDIENGLIKLDADKVTVSGNLRSASVGTLGASGNKIEIDDSTFKVYNSAGIVGLEIGWDSEGNPFLVLRDRTGRDGYKLTYNSIGNASANFTNDEFSAMKLYQLVNGRTYDNLEISEFFDARRDPSETLIDPNYYMYSAAKNLSTDVYKIDDYDYDGSHREYTDGKTFDTNDLSDVLGAFPDNYMIPDGYYINDMITGDNHQGRFGPVYQKNLYQAAQGVLSVVGSICFIGVYDDREEEWSYYFTKDIEGTGTWKTIFTASDYLF